MIDFNQLCSDSRMFNENRDCAVKAVAAAAQVPYKVALDALAKNGRRPRKGTYPRQTYAALKDLGFDTKERSFVRCTIRTVTQQLPRIGRFLVHTSGHILAVVDGQVMDWTNGRLHKVKGILEVVPTPGVQRFTDQFGTHAVGPVAPVVVPKPVQVRPVPRATSTEIEWFREPISVNVLAMKMGPGVSNNQARGLIDRLRRQGHPIVNCGRNMFVLRQA